MPLVFDVRTLFFVGSVASFVCGAMLWLTRGLHAPSRPALLWSSAALSAFGAAMLLIALRGWVSDLLSWPIANALGSGAAVLMYESVRRLAGVRPMPWLVVGIFAMLLAANLAMGSDAAWFELRLQITSVVQGGFAIASVPLLVARWRTTDSEPAAPMRWAIGFLCAFAVGHALRFLVTAVAGAPIAGDGFVHGPLQTLMPTVYALAPMVYGLILIGLVNGRLATELWTLATVDNLTGVRSRRAFIDDARRALADGGRPALMMLDLDRFKQINDRYGHASGDQVLVRFARLLRETFPPDAVIGRYGGEEFCLLLPDAPTGAGRVLAQRLCDAVRTTAFGLATPEPTVTVSVGVAGASDGGTLEELLIAADRRLYLAKARGRDRVVSTDRTYAPDTRPLDRTADDAAGPQASPMSQAPPMSQTVQPSQTVQASQASQPSPASQVPQAYATVRSDAQACTLAVLRADTASTGAPQTAPRVGNGPRVPA